jgi:uncharacterized protein
MKETDKKPKLSAEIFIIPVEENRYLVYAPLRKAAFVGNAPVVNFLADLKEGVYRAEADPDGTVAEFLRRLEIVDAGDETPPSGLCEGAPEPVGVSLFLTTACNLRCTYCYASAGDTVREKMPFDVAARGIDFVLRNAVRRKAEQIELNYHGGGEPTVHWSVLTRSLAYARRQAEAQGLKVTASTATNGMLNDRQIDWITTNLQGVSLSCDGLPEAQDRHRVRPSGRGSSSRVVHTLRRLDEAGFNYGIRMTATADLIPYMADSVDYLFSNFKIGSVQVEPAYQIGRYADRPSAETEEFLYAFREAQRRAKAHGRELTYSGARVGILTCHFCAVSQDSFALLPDGTVSSCFEACSHSNPYSPLFFYGKEDAASDSGYRFDMERLSSLRRQAVQFRDHCRGCFAKWTCAGDCYHKAVTVMGGEGEFTGTGRCHINRELTKDQILARIKDAGGLCWHELPDHLREQAYRHQIGQQVKGAQTAEYLNKQENV